MSVREVWQGISLVDGVSQRRGGGEGGMLGVKVYMGFCIAVSHDCI